MLIRVENTAISNGVAQSVKEYSEFLASKNQSILDYGAGKLRNTNFVYNRGFKDIDILDTQLQMQRLGTDCIQSYGVYTDQNLPQKQYDLILCNFVINVIPYQSTRLSIIKNIHTFLKDTGAAIFEVRKSHSILRAKYKEHYLDGFLTLPRLKSVGFLLPKAKYISAIADVQVQAVPSALIGQSI